MNASPGPPRLPGGEQRARAGRRVGASSEDGATTVDDGLVTVLRACVGGVTGTGSRTFSGAGLVGGQGRLATFGYALG